MDRAQLLRGLYDAKNTDTVSVFFAF